MSYQFPYSYFNCPCTRNGRTEGGSGAEAKASVEPEEEEEPFDPRSPRSKYSLYPLDHLLWCEECHQIRCPRCTVEEVNCWYCPSCLFEVASSMIKSEGNRCTRNCFNCPICTAPLAVNTLDSEPGSVSGPWILACDYCNWTTLDINIRFDKPNNIHGQLQRLQSGKPARPSASRTTTTSSTQPDSPTSPAPAPAPSDHDSRFHALRAFYVSQLQKSQPAGPPMSPGGDINYSSPSSLARIMSIYTNSSGYGKKAAKVTPMRSAETAQEGLFLNTLEEDEDAIARLHAVGLEGTATMEQRLAQPGDMSTRFVDDLKPVPTLLRTKRSRRCRMCRHILVKPESKVTSTRFRIKLVAYEHIPMMELEPLQQPSLTSTGTASTNVSLSALPPSRPLQFLLKFTNPNFEPIKVHLATPPTTKPPPGKPGAASRVTILCPQFECGPNTDVWDEALSNRLSKVPLGRDADARSAEGRVAEAGKVWEKGRNWTTVVLEVVCGRLKEGEEEEVEDEDVLEIPMFVRIEYEEDAPKGEGEGKVGEDKKVKKEISYWCVLGVGKIAKVVA
ncbi:MAG: hypothetical protein MMC23_002572 [Stictis urceolatum]|nr:hypothetical protein [Stictis urceolata]